MKAITFVSVILLGAALFFFTSEMQVGLLEQTSYIPPRYQYTECVTYNQCKGKRCLVTQRACQTNATNVANCKKTTKVCQDWEIIFQKQAGDDLLTKEYYECEKTCGTPKASSDPYWLAIQQCDHSCGYVDAF